MILLQLSQISVYWSTRTPSRMHPLLTGVAPGNRRMDCSPKGWTTSQEQTRNLAFIPYLWAYVSLLFF